MPIWIDDREVEGSVTGFDLSDRGLMLGDGLFDTSLAVAGRPVWGNQHLDRLAAQAAVLGIPLVPEAAAHAMLRAAAAIGTGAIRLTLTRGPGPRGVLPPVEPRPQLITSAVAGAPLAAFRAVRLADTAIRRNQTSPQARLKTLGYLDQVLAMRDAVAAGADDALFLNTAGWVASAGTANVFALSGRVLITPPVEDGVLAGVTRTRLLDLAPEAGLMALEQSLSREDLLSADAVLITSSLRLVAPVVALSGRPLSRAGWPVALRLAELLAADIAADCGPLPEALCPPARFTA